VETTVRATSDDPLIAAVLDALNDLLERNERVGRVLAEAVRSLASPPQPAPAWSGAPPAAAEAIPAPSPESQSSVPGPARAFQERLEEVYGVARVTFDGSGPDGFRFLVEMANPARRSD
jgi:hypothetical protein